MNKRITLVNRTIGNNRKIEYIVIHYVGAVSTAKSNADYFYLVNRQASAHYFVDEKEIWQVVEDKDISWAVGANKYYNSCRNSNSINIEMCVKKKDGKWFYEPNTITQTINLTKELMKKYNIDEEHVVRHYDVTHKNCPADFDWAFFKSNLKEETEVRYKFFDDIPDWGKPTIQKLMDNGDIKGDGNGILDLSKDMVRTFVILDRNGLIK